MTRFLTKRNRLAVLCASLTFATSAGALPSAAPFVAVASASEAYDTQVLSDRQQIAQNDVNPNKQLSKEAFARQKVDVETFSGTATTCIPARCSLPVPAVRFVSSSQTAAASSSRSSRGIMTSSAYSFSPVRISS